MTSPVDDAVVVMIISSGFRLEICVSATFYLEQLAYLLFVVIVVIFLLLKEKSRPSLNTYKKSKKHTFYKIIPFKLF